MIEIKSAKKEDIEILALLGRITYKESHGHFIEDKNDLSQYIDKAFSVKSMNLKISDSQNLFYILYVNKLPGGYGKLVLNKEQDGHQKGKQCRLERIYILDEFLPLKIGQQFLDFLIVKARELKFDSICLTVYIKNFRAIRFYERNDFKQVGEMSFLVNATAYKNFIYLKQL